MKDNKITGRLYPVTAFVTFTKEEGFERCINNWVCDYNLFGNVVYPNNCLKIDDHKFFV